MLLNLRPLNVLFYYIFTCCVHSNPAGWVLSNQSDHFINYSYLFKCSYPHQTVCSDPNLQLLPLCSENVLDQTCEDLGMSWGHGEQNICLVRPQYLWGCQSHIKLYLLLICVELQQGQNLKICNIPTL